MGVCVSEINMNNLPSSDHQNRPKMEDITVIPSYRVQGFTGFLDEPEDTEKDDGQAKYSKPNSSCFNCDGDHTIVDCPHPKNYQKIARNRRKFFESRPSNLRYHQETENQYSNKKPGQYSSKLLRALGIGHKDIPDFIYRMRYLGYPKGWLKDAEIRKSSVSVFDSEGKDASGGNGSHYETVDYEPTKIISFPGFNAPLLNKERDEWRRYGYPPMDPRYSKTSFIAHIKRNKSRHQKRSGYSRHPGTSVDDIEPETMDVEVLNDCTIEVNCSNKTEETSVSNIEMEEGECEDSVSGPSSPVKNNDVPSPAPGSPVKNNDVPSPAPGSPVKNGDDTVPATKTVDSPSTVLRPFKSLSKSRVPGIGIPISERKTLPSADKWAANISDTVIFENLPDAVGKWSRMKCLVNRVREDLKKTT